MSEPPDVNTMTHDEALRLIRQLHKRFACIEHARHYCSHHPTQQALELTEIA